MLLNLHNISSLVLLSTCALVISTHLETLTGLFDAKTKAMFEAASTDASVGVICKQEITILLDHINSTWAKQLLDSSGMPPPSGVSNGNLYSFGDYDLCRTVHAPVTSEPSPETSLEITGRYCLAILKPTELEKLFYFGLCLPYSCCDKDASVMIAHVLDHSAAKYNVTCKDKTTPFNVAAMLCILLLSIFGVLVLCATIYDLVLQRYKCDDTSGTETNTCCSSTSSITSNNTIYTPLCVKEPISVENPPICRRALLAFSLYTNTKKLFTTTSPAGIIKSLDCMRVLSLSWIVYGHVYNFALDLIRNKSSARELIDKNIFSQPLMNYGIPVDTFFVISGILVAYNRMNLMTKDPTQLKSAKSWIMFYVHRYLRLTPLYAIILFVYITLFRHLVDGPMWLVSPKHYDSCVSEWWTHLLYILNLYNITGTCFIWGWYLSNDMQYYVLSPLLIVPLFLKPLVGFVIVAILLVAQFVYRGVMSAQIGLAFGRTFNTPGFPNTIEGEFYYTMPYSRFAPYVVGIVVGYFFHKNAQHRQLPKAAVIVGWTVCISITTFLTYGTYQEIAYSPYPNEFDAVVNTFNRTLWGLAISWIIYAVNSDQAGVVGDILTWRVWSPLARLSYAGYLLQGFVIELYAANRRTPIYITNYYIVYTFLGTMTMTLFLSYASSMAIEIPLLAIEKMVFAKLGCN